MKYTVAFAFAGMLVSGGLWATGTKLGAIRALAGGPAIYDERADGPSDIATALIAARDQHKAVLVVFGANWCPDCRGLHREVQTGELKDVLERGYIVVHADVGRFSKNIELATRLGLNVRRGIPSLVILGEAAAPLVVLDGQATETLRGAGVPAMASYFQGIAAKAPRHEGDGR